MRYLSPGMSITITGQVLEDGARGSTVDVRNLTSKKIVRAVVEDANTVDVSPNNNQALNMQAAPPQGADPGKQLVLNCAQPCALLLAIDAACTGCAKTIAELENVGNPPPLAQIKNPDAAPDYKPLTWPMPETPPPPKQYANSLWQPGARAFFRDGRAARVGDILRVKVRINDQAQVDNETERQRTGTDTVAAPEIFGMQNRLFKWLPAGKADPASLLDATSQTDSKGTGTIKRQEIVTTQVAALITQILPNGNFVIEGKQEMLINYDIREVSVQGIVRPQDIASDNTVDSTQIAEARITYGGHGQLMDVQQPRWGSQVVETLSPF